MSLSTHYYALTLSAKTIRLYEAFREYLIDIDNQSFSIEAPDSPLVSSDHGQLLALARTADECFGHYYTRDPLRVVVVGERTMQAAFSVVTTHADAIIGRVEGDHTATSARDLGQIVWPVVKEAISGMLDAAMRNLEVSAGRGQVSCGLESVARTVSVGVPATLLVEDGYHVRGSIVGTSRALFVSPEVDVRETMDDAVDAVIEKVLESGGNVVFTPLGSLKDRNRIVLLPHDEVSDA